MKKKKNIGFLVCGVGNGHLTQAKTVYNILKKNGYKIPIIVACCQKKKPKWKTIFPKCDIDHEKIPVSEEATNNMSIFTIIKFFISAYTKVNVEKYIKKYNLDMMITFWTPNFVTSFSVPCISLAYQFSDDNILTKFTIKNTAKHQTLYQLLNKIIIHLIGYLI